MQVISKKFINTILSRIMIFRSWCIAFTTRYKPSPAAVLAASLDRLGQHGSVQVWTLYKSSSAAVLAASLDRLGQHGSVQVLQLMMTCIELKLAQIHVALISPTRQQVLQLMMTSLLEPCKKNMSSSIMGKTSPKILVCTFSTTSSGALRSNFSSRLVN